MVNDNYQYVTKTAQRLKKVEKKTTTIHCRLHQLTRMKQDVYCHTIRYEMLF